MSKVKTPIDMEQLLIWTYRDQKVDLEVGRAHGAAIAMLCGAGGNAARMAEDAGAWGAQTH